VAGPNNYLCSRCGGTGIDLKRGNDVPCWACNGSGRKEGPSVTDHELPGMWEQADLTGGWTDTDSTPAAAIPDEAVELFCRVVGISDNRVREGLAAVWPLLTDAARAEVAAPVLARADEWEDEHTTPNQVDTHMRAVIYALRDAVSPEGVAAHEAHIWQSAHDSMCEDADLCRVHENPYRADAIEGRAEGDA
jgi:hypothetical protein